MTEASKRDGARFARIWRGMTTSANAEAYEAYWLENGVAGLKARGAVAVDMMRDDQGERTEFVTVSYWRSLDDMTGSSGQDPTATHHLDRDGEFLIELPEKVQVLRILSRA